MHSKIYRNLTLYTFTKINLCFYPPMCEINGFTHSSLGKKKDGNYKILPTWVIKLEKQTSFHNLTCEGTTLLCPPGIWVSFPASRQYNLRKKKIMPEHKSVWIYKGSESYNSPFSPQWGYILHGYHVPINKESWQ